MQEAQPNTAMIFVPPRFAADSILEAAAAGRRAGDRDHRGHPRARRAARLQHARARPPGHAPDRPQLPGHPLPGQGQRRASSRRRSSSEGNVGVVSRSGTLTYQIGNEIAQAGFGCSSIVGIGGDPVPGSSFVDVLELFQADEQTELVVLSGEIGGSAEEEAAEYIAEHVTKPVVAYIAGFTAPAGKQMGHAGAIVSGSAGTAAAKAQALEAQGRARRAHAHRGGRASPSRSSAALRSPPAERGQRARTAARWTGTWQRCELEASCSSSSGPCGDRDAANARRTLESPWTRELARTLGEHRAQAPGAGARSASDGRPSAPARRRAAAAPTPAARLSRRRPRRTGPTPAPRPRGARRHGSRPAAVQARSSRSARRAPAHGARPGARQPRAQPPSAAELLRFRERLERTARELTHDYDELLGRLSFAAMPAPTGPTISFARGAPSLDIIDVEGLSDAAVRAFESDPGGHDRLRHLGRLSAPARLDRRPARRRARARARHQRLAAGRRVPVRAPRAPRRRGDRRAPHLRPHAAVAAPARRAAARRRAASPTASTPRRSRACSAGGGARRSSPTSSPTSRTPPATRSRCRSAARCSSWPPQHGFLVLRGRPLRGAALQRRVAADDALDGPRARGLRLVLLEDRLPGHPRRLPGRAAGADRRRWHSCATNTYISPNMVAAVDRLRVLRLGRDRALDRDGQRGARRARARARRARCAASCPRPSSSRPQGGYFMWVTLPPGTDVARAVRAPPPSAGWRS